jgi:hypothetical protein
LVATKTGLGNEKKKSTSSRRRCIFTLVTQKTNKKRDPLGALLLAAMIAVILVGFLFASLGVARIFTQPPTSITKILFAVGVFSLALFLTTMVVDIRRSNARIADANAARTAKEAAAAKTPPLTPSAPAPPEPPPVLEPAPIAHVPDKELNKVDF